MTNATRKITDPLERLAIAAERIADAMERGEVRAKRGMRVSPKTEKYILANDTDKALAKKVAGKIGLSLVKSGGEK